MKRIARAYKKTSCGFQIKVRVNETDSDFNLVEGTQKT